MNISCLHYYADYHESSKTIKSPKWCEIIFFFHFIIPKLL